MKLEPFEMERWQSTYEHDVKYNLSESGVEPISVAELLPSEDLKILLNSPLGYPETQGSRNLRSVIASLYPGATAENVLVTSGTSEANFLTALWSMEGGTDIVTVLPNYMQVWGLARSLGCRVKELFLREDRGWQLSQEEVKEAVGPRTKAVSLSNPNNPTGSRLDLQSRQALLDAAEEAGAWVLSDEVYRGAERDSRLTPTLWGEYERVLITSGVSKAFGLPGLRLGWICGPSEAVQEMWAAHDYTTIAIGKVTEVLGEVALGRMREKLWTRSRQIIARNFPLLESFVGETGLSWRPPEAGAVAFAKYPWTMPSAEIADSARKRGVLIVPGSQFKMEGFLRFGFGMQVKTLRGGLERLEGVFRELGES